MDARLMGCQQIQASHKHSATQSHCTVPSALDDSTSEVFWHGTSQTTPQPTSTIMETQVVEQLRRKWN